MDPVQDYYDSAALLERLTEGIRRANQRVIFLVGSALPAPTVISGPGVPGVEGVIEIIKKEFENPEQLSEREKVLSEQGNRYQNAFTFLLGRRGQQTVNEVIKRAVWNARRPLITTTATTAFLPTASTPDSVCESLDRDLDGWSIAPGLSALAELATNYPDRFGRTILTTNFDPLLEVAIGKSGGYYFRTILHRDGDISQSQGPGCHVIHLHGYWYGSDTLHTPRQITQPRPRLKASLASLIKGSVLVVSGYSGWDDTFSEALMDVVLDDSAYADAIKWGTEGKELKDQTGVDTNFSTDHNLALAQRDSGLIDPALLYFLRGQKLEDVIDADELEETRHGSYYGNIGRCLHLMGQIDPALICYRKSAMLFERDGSITHVENKGFARKWVAELLIAKGEYCAAKAFLHAAKKKWETVCPPRMADIDRLLNSFEKEMNQCQNLAVEDSERFCIAWIFGREAEFEPLEIISSAE